MNIFYFWYPHSFNFFLQLWKNTISFLEEDLAVGLMIKLLFVPLFHDSSFMGKVLSFFFRLTRIFIGFLAFAAFTLLFLILAASWFLLPILLPLSIFLSKYLALFLFAYFLFGIASFLNQRFHYPALTVWKIKSVDQIWQATQFKKAKFNWAALLQEKEVLDLLQLLELKLTDIQDLPAPTATDESLNQVLSLAKMTKAKYITPAYFFVALFKEIPEIDQLLLKLNLQSEDFVQALKYFENRRNKWRRIALWDDDFAVRHLKGTNRGWLSAPTPNLDAVTKDLTLEAARYGFPDFIGRSATLNQVVSILSQDADRNVLLIAEPGSGKSMMIRYLAKLIISGDAPDALATKRLVELDLTRLLSSVTSEGDLATKVKAVFEELEFVQDVIVFVDEIHNLGLGEAGSNYNLYSLMLPYIESGKFQFIATTEVGNYARILEKNGSFARIFHKVDLPPASVAETTEIIGDRAVDLARTKKIFLTFLAIKEMSTLSAKLIHDRVLPDSALALLQETEVMAENGWVTSTVVKKAIERKINVPIIEVNGDQKQLLLNLEDVIHQKMIDQQEAVSAVANTLRRAATALREESRPIGSFLFVGPTGVGKTELAKILAESYFKSAASFIRFDMSEYQTSEAVSRLIGSSDRPGEMTELIKNKPYVLILLDEFEKANPQLLTLFLQVLEEGRLTDFAGTHVDFTNTIIIATSNAASLIIAQGLQTGKTVAQIEPQVKDELLKVYKPELVNRFDQVVIFKPLSAEDLQKIVVIKLQALQKQIKEQGYIIDFAPDVVAEIAKKGYDPVLGARPMKRVIQDTLESNLSKLILSGKLVKGTPFKVDLSLIN